MTVSSTEAATDTAVDVVQDVNAAEPSVAGQDQGVGSYEAAVEAALKGPEAAPASEQGSKDPDPDSPVADKPVSDEVPEEELKTYGPGAQRRIRELVEKSKTVTAEVETFRQEVETLKPKAERLDQLTGYMQQHDIQPDHLNNALGLTALINKGDYRQALPILESLIAQVRNAAGEVLPADLQQQVNLGYITEAHAKELNRTKTEHRQVVERTQRDREKAEETERKREVETVTQIAVTTADAWNQEQVKSDPDWNLKRDLVKEKMELALTRRLREKGPAGYPRTAQDVRKLLEESKTAVETEIKRFRPAPKPISTATGGSVSPRSAAKPASYLEAIEAGIASRG